MNSHKGELKIDTKNVIEGDLKSKLIDIFTSKDDKRNKYMKIRQAVADSRTQDFTDLYSYFYEKVDDYAEGNTANVILTISERQSKDALVVDKEIQFMALMIELLNLLN